MTTPAAYLAHYPLSAALKAHAAGEPLPRWELHPVDVEAARPWADMLHTLRRARPAVAFPGRADVVEVVDGCPDRWCRAGWVQYPEWEGKTQRCPTCNPEIAAPDTSHGSEPSVEQPAGGVVPSAPPATLSEADMDKWLTACAADPSIVTPREMGYLPDGTRRTYDVDRFGRPVLPPADEGDDADPAAVAVLKTRYAALEGDGRLWVNAVAKQAQAAGGALSLADSQPQSIRRFEAMRALVLLAEGGFADDPATRGILRPILGDVADMPIFTVGKLVAHLNQHQAARFARYADTVTNGAAALAVKLDGTYHWELNL